GWRSQSSMGNYWIFQTNCSLANPSNRRHFPLKRAEFREPAEITLVGRDHADPKSSSAHREQGVIGQTSAPDLFVVILGSQSSQNLACLSPVAEVRHQNSIDPVEVSL